MARISAPARATPPQPFTRAHTEEQLRHLKRRLRTRFPQVKSSHIVEALAAAQGFNTYAALLAAVQEPMRLPLGPRFDTQKFRQRLLLLDYDIQRDFTFGPASQYPAPPDHYRAWLDELRALNVATRNSSRIEQLQRQCAREFAKAFGLGQPSRGYDSPAFKRWYAGVDEGACLPGWGELVNRRTGAGIDFPGSDHRVFFLRQLPLSSGKHVEYEDAIVSMPYADSDWRMSNLGAAQDYAGRIGWRCSVHPEWSWYSPGASTLILYRRTTPYEVTLQAWETSFKRWLMENSASPRDTEATSRTRRKSSWVGGAQSAHWIPKRS